MLSPKDAFKVGFLERCVEQGMGPAEMLAAVKTASDVFEKRGFLGDLLGKTVDVAKGVGGAALGYGLPLALAAPVVGGGALGYGLARATDIDDTDVDEIKSREIIEEYARQAAKLRQQKDVRDYHQRVKRTGRMFH